MGNRFQEAVESAGEHEKTITELIESSLELGKEIAERGSLGEELTDAEKRFVKATTLFMLHGLLVASSRRK